MAKITEGTLLPLSIVGIIGTAVVGGVFWLSSMHAQGNNSAKDIEALKDEQKTTAQEIVALKLQVQNVAVILERVERKIDYQLEEKR